MYNILFSKEAIREVSVFEKKEPQVFKKIEKLLLELADNTVNTNPDAILIIGANELDASNWTWIQR